MLDPYRPRISIARVALICLAIYAAVFVLTALAMIPDERFVNGYFAVVITTLAFSLSPFTLGQMRAALVGGVTAWMLLAGFLYIVYRNADQMVIGLALFALFLHGMIVGACVPLFYHAGRGRKIAAALISGLTVVATSFLIFANS